MRTQVKIEADYDGIRELLTSSEVQADLNDRAAAVAKAATDRGVMVDGEPGVEPVPITVTEAGTSRARALVTIDHPSGLAVEAKHRLLVGSLDAAHHA